MAGDYFDTAQSQNDTAKAALLEAIRTQGSQAKAAFDQAQQQVAAQKQQALAAALQDSARRGAPQAMQDQVSSTISAPYDRQLSDLSASQASRAQSFDQTGARAGAYLTEANASLPVLRERQAEQKATLEHQLAAQQASAARASAGRAAAAAKPPTTGQILGEFGGQSGFNDVVDQAVPQVVDSTPAGDYMNPNGPFWSAMLAQGTDATPTDQRIGMAIADRIGQNAGLPQGLAPALYAPHAATTLTKADTATTKQFNADNPDIVAIGKHVGLSTKGTQDMLNTAEYKNAVKLAELYAQQGKTVDQLKAALGSAAELQNKPKTREAVLYQYGSQLVSSGYQP